MSKRVRTTDYNSAPAPGRVSRITGWWFAPRDVTARSKKVSATFLLLVLATVLYFAVSSAFSTSSADTHTQPVAAPTEAAQKTVCPTAKAENVPPEVLINTAYSTTWVRDGDMVRPSSETAGPGTVNPYPSCFSRTPEGALYAAASFASGILTATAAGDQKPFFQNRASHTGNYSILIADLPDAGPAKNRPTVRFSGYRWNGYTPDLASIEIRYTLVTGPRAGSNTAIAYNMAWERNDWLLVIPGKTDTAAAPVDTTRTYIPWGGAT